MSAMVLNSRERRTIFACMRKGNEEFGGENNEREILWERQGYGDMR